MFFFFFFLQYYPLNLRVPGISYWGCFDSLSLRSELSCDSRHWKAVHWHTEWLPLLFQVRYYGQPGAEVRTLLGKREWKKKNLNHESKVLKIPPLQQETIERMVWTIFFYNLKWRSVGRPGKIFWTRKWWELRRHDDPFLVICHKHFFRDIVGSDIRLFKSELTTAVTHRVKCTSA